MAIDADILSVGWTKLVPDDGATRTQTTLGVGPNQFGASEVALPSAPLGFGVGYVLRPKIVLGARVGVGYDRSSSAGGEPASSYLTWTFMPGINYVPFGDRAKLFLNFSPLLTCAGSCAQASRCGDDAASESDLHALDHLADIMCAQGRGPGYRGQS